MAARTMRNSIARMSGKLANQHGGRIGMKLLQHRPSHHPKTQCHQIQSQLRKTLAQKPHHRCHRQHRHQRVRHLLRLHLRLPVVQGEVQVTMMRFALFHNHRYQLPRMGEVRGVGVVVVVLAVVVVDLATLVQSLSGHGALRLLNGME